MSSEVQRLTEASTQQACWKEWGPYLSERAWGTVREDYSPDGEAWTYLTHDQSRSRTYRWNEDGLLGICDRHQRVCFALALWNGRDPILKERLFGLSGPEGNHGEDVKEAYFYLDSTPTHSYMKALYKYPQAPFPYAELLQENGRRSRQEPEYELVDTGVFDEDRYFDVLVEYAKGDVEDVLIRITATNRGPEPAPLHLLPTVWFRNSWSWNKEAPRPRLQRTPDGVALQHPELGHRWLHAQGAPRFLFTENQSNLERLFPGAKNDSPYVKDAFHAYLVDGDDQVVNPQAEGTKAAALYSENLAPGEARVLQLRLTARKLAPGEAFRDFSAVFETRQSEAEAFYQTVIPQGLDEEARQVMRQAFAGMLWSKQYYHYVVRDWLAGDPAFPPPPAERLTGRNHAWPHIYNADVLSMPDKWEYPWYAAWDLAFHCVTLALVDVDFAKEQLILLLREWYMHPSGQLPAYEWALDDVNPPVHAWAAWQIYQIEQQQRGTGDRQFLARIFQKLALNFTWWVNRKDEHGKNLFQGGFLGLDNIGVFDRNSRLPTGGYLEQSDGTSWMAKYCLDMLAIALELAKQDGAYEDMASKFWEHFVYIAHAMNHVGIEDEPLWDEEDGFYYDVLHLPGQGHLPLKVRSMVGLIPLFAVSCLEPDVFDHLEAFKQRFDWFNEHRRDLVGDCADMCQPGAGRYRLLALVDGDRLRRVLTLMLDESEFLSPHGIRSLSAVHAEHPYVLNVEGSAHRVDYEPAESTTGLFGGNSNWRGPVWFPVNYLIVKSLRQFYRYLGDDYKVECPTGSGTMMTLAQVADEIARRLTGIFTADARGRRPVHGDAARFQHDPHWKDLLLFHEYFHGETGQGLGASHQTGWTGLVANLLFERCHATLAREARTPASEATGVVKAPGAGVLQVPGSASGKRR